MKNFLTAILLGMVMTVHAQDPISIDVNKAKSSFVVTLDANPTTGYQWTVVDYDKELLQLTSSTYRRPDTKLIGAGGKMLYTFTLCKGKKYPDQTAITFLYARSWEKKESGTLQKVIIHFMASKT